MNKRKYVVPLFACIITVLIVIVSEIYLRSGGDRLGRTQVVISDIVVILILEIIVMVDALHRSLRESFYTYANIGLIGGIIFVFVLASVFFAYFILSVSADSVTLKQIYQAVLKFPRDFSYYAIFVIFAISLLVGISNVSLIRHEGFCLSNALSILIAVLYIGGTILIYLLSDLMTKYVFSADGLNGAPLFVILDAMIPTFLLLLLSYYECILVATGIMGYLAVRKTPSFDKDYIIILGCSIDKRGGLLPLLKGRVNRAIRFAWDQEIACGKPVRYVPSGGQGPNEVMSEGSAMELYLCTRGAEDYEVFPEKKSANTWENFCFSKNIIDKLDPNAKIAFATTNYHVLRSGILAYSAGLDAEGIAADTKWYFWPNGFVREFFAILALNKKAHIITTIGAALMCVVIGCIGYFGNLI